MRTKILILFIHFFTLSYSQSYETSDLNYSEAKIQIPENLGKSNLISLKYYNSNRNVELVYAGSEVDSLFIRIAKTEDVSDGRLRSFFLKYYGNMNYSNFKIIDKTNGVYSIKGITFEENGINYSIFGCGKWIFQYELKSSEQDAILEDLFHKFSPFDLCGVDQIKKEAKFHVAEASFKDEILLGSVIESATKKQEWFFNNIPESERYSGFTADLYLDMHMTALKSFLEFDKKNRLRKTKFTKNYLKELNEIIDAGFLDEFIMLSYNRLLIIPEGHKFDFDAFKDWSQSNPIEYLDLSGKFCVLSYNY